MFEFEIYKKRRRFPVFTIMDAICGSRLEDPLCDVSLEAICGSRLEDPLLSV